MSILPSETVAGAVLAHFGLTLGKVLPFARGYAAALGIAAEHLTVAHFFRYVRREGFEMVDALVAFLDGSDAGGMPRFTADTRRVYRQLLKHFAWLVFQARRDLFGGGAAAWAELGRRFAATGSRPNPKYRRAWALWTARCRQRGIDPFAPPDPMKDFGDFVRYLESWGYNRTTFGRYGWIIHSLLALLGAVDAPHQPLGPYAEEIDALVRAVVAHYQRVLEPTTIAATRRHLAMFARFLLHEHREPDGPGGDRHA
jgi:hypothetical protein